MAAPVYHSVYNNTFWLSPQRCVYWEEEQTLIVSDLHLGKTGHFRKMGIAVPQAVYKEDLQRLFSEIQFYKPKKLIVVGDLFHSRENKEMELFVKWRNDISYLDFILVKGNHDILKDEWYKAANIIVHEHQLCIRQFIFTHDANVAICTGIEFPYIFSGHIHPGVVIKTGSKQTHTFPCYHFSKSGVVLPAFSKFTGVYITPKQPGDAVFAIINQSVIRV